jgi:alkanesulfonate monooxygenase
MQIFTVTQPMLPGETDPSGVEARARELDASEALDRVLIGYSSIWPHNHAYAPYMLARTERLSLIVAHRPGVMDPAAAARYFSTLDVVSRGRLAVNLVIGGSDKDLAREGDYTEKAVRYQRAVEYLDVMRQTWTDEASFDHEGAFYQEQYVRQLVRPVRGSVPVFMGGDSPDAIDFGARHADMYMLWGEPLAGTKERIDAVRAALERYDRSLQFSLSLRLILGDTDEEAWAEARRIEQYITEQQGSPFIARSSASDTSTGRQRQLAVAEADELHDDCFWTRLVTLLGGFANSAALVGTPDRVLETLARYRDLGVGAFLVTTGPFGIWDPRLEEFLRRVKEEL